MFENKVIHSQRGQFAYDFNPTPEEIVNDQYFRLVQFVDLPSSEVRGQLNDLGISFLGYYPTNTYLVSLPVELNTEVLTHFDISMIIPIPWEAKVSKDIYNGEIGDWALNGESASVVIQYPKSIPIEILTAQLSGKARLHSLYEDYNLIYGQVNVNELYELAKLPSVQYLSLIAEPGQPEDIEGRTLHRSNVINSDALSGLKYDGTGVNVLTRDDGVVGPHIDYKGRLDNLMTAGLVTTDHADMVSGIFAGGGILNPRAQGMASGAYLYVVNYIDHFMDNTLDLHQDENVMVTNSSYSNGCNDGYTTITQTVDRQIEQNPSFLHVFSAGNSGTLNCGYGAGNRWGNITGGHKIGKNVIATANLRLDVSLENSSSRGPASDGRLKPDLSARGTDQLSTDPDNLYSPGGGTSAASPGVAGVSAQLYHAYRDLNNGEDPESALIKAALMNTANDLGNEGPDFLYGWGHINALRAYELLKDKRYEKGTVDQQEEGIHEFEVTEALHELRIMLYWREPAGTPGAGIALVNDLDLVVTDQNGTDYLPWLLDPTPDPVGLNEPAGHGRDSLNNVEQVLIRNLEPGTYTIKVRGFSLPFGARDYYLLYETKSEAITLTYPYGGEGFDPGTTEQIHWDAITGNGQFTLEYSTDNQASWKSIGTASSDARTFTWAVPNEVSAQCYIRVSRASETSENSKPFSIVGTPLGLRATKVCPDYVGLTWERVEGADTYEILQLGETKMEVVATSDTNYAEIGVLDVLEDMWFSVRALGDNGLRSSRSVAAQHNTGLLDCSAGTDVGIVRLLSPNANLVYSCDNFNEPVVLELKNNGANAVTELTVNYQADGGAVMSETVNVDLLPGEQKVVTLSENFNIASGGVHNIKVWIELSGDELPGNDIVERDIDILVLSSAASLDYAQDFEGQNFPPLGYDISSEVDQSQWEQRPAVGADGGPTNAASIQNQANIEIFYKDALFTEAIDLTTATRPIVFFDYAYHCEESSSYKGELSVNVYSFCGERRVVQLMNRLGIQMKTSPSSATFPWMPSSESHWQRVGFNLEEFVGSEVVLEFVMEHGLGTGLYIDNINIEESDVDFPSAEILFSKDNPCSTFEAVQIEAANPNADYDYSWSFGDRVVPKSAVGPGPHTVRFLSAQDFLVQLEVIDAESGAFASAARNISVSSQPTPNFDFDVTDNVVAFTNRSSRSDSFLWEFGDGNTSTEENPTHIYQSDGVYTVKLHASSPCATRVKEAEVQILMVGTSDEKSNGLTVYPNPGYDRVKIEGIELPASTKMLVYTLEGKVVELNSKTTNSGFEIEVDHLAPGIYLMKFWNANGWNAMHRLIID